MTHSGKPEIPIPSSCIVPPLCGCFTSVLYLKVCFHDFEENLHFLKRICIGKLWQWHLLATKIHSQFNLNWRVNKATRKWQSWTPNPGHQPLHLCSYWAQWCADVNQLSRETHKYSPNSRGNSPIMANFKLASLKNSWIFVNQRLRADASLS